MLEIPPSRAHTLAVSGYFGICIVVISERKSFQNHQS